MIKLVVVGVVLIIALAALVRLVEPRFAFFPSAGDTPPPTEPGIQITPWSVATRDGERLQGWSLEPAAPRAVVVYFHGNGGNLSNWASILAAVARHGLAVVAFDYRGYGTSTGRPTEQGLYRDVDAVVERLRTLPRRPLPVVYWGRSLGTTMAAYATTVAAPDGVILESGFPDARSVARTSPALALLAVFSSYRFPTADFMRRSVPPPPTLVMHGDRDSVVPIALGRALFTRINEPKTFATIRGGDHNDAAPSDPAYWPQVDHFVAGLRTERRAPSRD
ncbi:MAG TPA: alpha/beta hydrolase [Vicinamibacterales bacterium]|nr:alpha/beta hydrolase [Vicinamibacterales bacterium]